MTSKQGFSASTSGRRFFANKRKLALPNVNTLVISNGKNIFTSNSSPSHGGKWSILQHGVALYITCINLRKFRKFNISSYFAIY